MGRRVRAPGALVMLMLVALLTAGCGGDGGGSGDRTLNWYTFDEPSGAFDDGVKNCNEEAGGKYGE